MKKLITCSDGTWNKPGEIDGDVVANTNVCKIHDCILESATQKRFYDKGVGTGSREDVLAGGLTGKGIDQNIKDVYTFLVNNYEDKDADGNHDEIYLFGFSRGAYTARSAAGMIRNCGILRRDNLSEKEIEEKVNEAFGLYRDRSDDTHPASQRMESYKSQFSHQPRIKFIGVWDTVGSLGIPLGWFHELNDKKYKFHDTTLSSYVDYAYHALAIDERRVLFKPTLWKKSDVVNKDPDHPQQMEQRWFAGVHSNVGGGYADCGLSDLALQWLVGKAQDTGLQFDSGKCHGIKGEFSGILRNSYTFKYWFWPRIWREILNGDNDSEQVIDDSVWERYNSMADYRPGNLKKV
jgi:uncharacterized protein (DUF2235 family)